MKSAEHTTSQQIGALHLHNGRYMYEILLIIAHAQNSVTNANAGVSMKARSLRFGPSLHLHPYFVYSKTCVKLPLSKRPKIGFQGQWSLNAGQKYCRMLQGEHSAILSTFIMLPFVIKIFVLSIFEWPFYTGMTV